MTRDRGSITVNRTDSIETRTIPNTMIAGRYATRAIPRECGAVPMIDRGRIIPIIRFADERGRNLKTTENWHEETSRYCIRSEDLTERKRQYP